MRPGYMQCLDDNVPRERCTRRLRESSRSCRGDVTPNVPLVTMAMRRRRGVRHAAPIAPPHREDLGFPVRIALMDRRHTSDSVR